MASYNAGRSLCRLLTDGAFDAMERDASGYVSAADAAGQLLTRRRRRHDDDEANEGEANEGSSRGGDVEMRSFLESMVASFCRSKAGRLNRREFARMYETFLKRPAEFSQLMMAMQTQQRRQQDAGATNDEDEVGESDEEEEAEDGTEVEEKVEKKESDQAHNGGEANGCRCEASNQQEQQQEQPKEALQPAPQMSRDQLRSLVVEVNRRLAAESEDEEAARGQQKPPGTAEAAAAAKDVDELHLD